MTASSPSPLLHAPPPLASPSAAHSRANSYTSPRGTKRSTAGKTATSSRRRRSSFPAAASSSTTAASSTSLHVDKSNQGKTVAPAFFRLGTLGITGDAAKASAAAKRTGNSHSAPASTNTSPAVGPVRVDGERSSNELRDPSASSRGDDEDDDADDTPEDYEEDCFERDDDDEDGEDGSEDTAASSVINDDAVTSSATLHDSLKTLSLSPRLLDAASVSTAQLQPSPPSSTSSSTATLHALDALDSTVNVDDNETLLVQARAQRVLRKTHEAALGEDPMLAKARRALWADDDELEGDELEERAIDVDIEEDEDGQGDESSSSLSAEDDEDEGQWTRRPPAHATAQPVTSCLKRARSRAAGPDSQQRPALRLRTSSSSSIDAHTTRVRISPAPPTFSTTYSPAAYSRKGEPPVEKLSMREWVELQGVREAVGVWSGRIGKWDGADAEHGAETCGVNREVDGEGDAGSRRGSGIGAAAGSRSRSGSCDGTTAGSTTPTTPSGTSLAALVGVRTFGHPHSATATTTTTTTASD